MPFPWRAPRAREERERIRLQTLSSLRVWSRWFSGAAAVCSS